jgi:hypothetical protein
VDNACSRSLARRDVFYREALNELLQLLFGNRFVVRIAACDVGIIQKSSSRRRCLAMALTMTSTSSVGPVAQLLRSPRCSETWQVGFGNLRDHTSGGPWVLEALASGEPSEHIRALIRRIVPFEISGKQHTVAQLQYNGTPSNTARLWVAASSPGIFTMGGLGNQVAAFNQDGTLNSPTNPA